MRKMFLTLQGEIIIRQFTDNLIFFKKKINFDIIPNIV